MRCANSASVDEGGVAQPERALDMSGRKPASWVIKEKVSGRIILETFDERKVAALNRERYLAAPILDHLAGLNAEISAGTGLQSDVRSDASFESAPGLRGPNFRVWPDGTTQSSEDGEPYPWMSDDFLQIDAGSEEEALEIAARAEMARSAGLRGIRPRM